MSRSIRVLMVEDSEDDALLVINELQRAGYNPIFKRVETAETMNEALENKTWDLIIADYSMPHFSGMKALELLRQKGLDLPFIIVSGTIGEDTAVAAMKAGANDYLMKDNLKRLGPAIERELCEAEIRRKAREDNKAFDEHRKLLHSVIEGITDPIFAKDKTGRYMIINSAGAKKLGMSVGEVIGKNDLELFSNDIAQNIMEIDKSVISSGIAKTYEETVTTRDGKNSFLTTKAPYSDGEGHILGLIGIARDITRLKETEETIHRLAYYDLLTGLPNRLMLHIILDKVITKAKNEVKTFALLLLDLNRFKEINDTLGHHNGDYLLQQISQRLKNLVKENDTVSRLGGDEFAVLIPGADAEVAKRIAGQIKERLLDPFEVEGITIDISATVGIALFPGHGEDYHTLIMHADIAMQEAKSIEEGFCLYSRSYNKYTPEHLTLVYDLRQAVNSDQLFLLYQPKIDLKTGKAIGVEALVRWRHPKLGIIPPGEFIEIAEKTGLIKPLTFCVLKEAIRQTRSWSRKDIDISLAVNLSIRSLQSSQLIDYLSGLLSTWGMAPSSLILEITESVIMSDPERTLDSINELTAMGIRFSIDDFGTGYSSLSYLQRLPVDEIKIDKSFVMNMMKDENSMKITQSIIGLGHSLGYKVTAEGVESKETLEKLKSLGCDVAQGYFISKPIPMEELITWLENKADACR